MRKQVILALAAITTLTGMADAQDVVVMRRAIAPPRTVAPVVPVPKGPAELITNGAMNGTTGWQSSATLSTFGGALKIPRAETGYQTTAYQAEVGFNYTVRFAFSAYNFSSNPAKFSWTVIDTDGTALASGSINAEGGSIGNTRTWGTFAGTGKAVKILFNNTSSNFCCPDSLLVDNVSISR